MPEGNYRIGGPRPTLPPDHGRLARAMTDAELEEEILRGLGDTDYQRALLAEFERRAARPPEET